MLWSMVKPLQHVPGATVGITCKPELTLVFDASGNRIADLHVDSFHDAEHRAGERAAAN